MDLKETDQIKFNIKSKDGNRGSCGKKNMSLQDAFWHDYPSYVFDDGILFATLKHSNKQVAILPTILVGWLEDGCLIEKVHMSGKNKKIALKDQVGQTTHNSERDFNKETRFFVKTDGMKNKRKIVKLKSDDYKYQELCVTAVCGETFQEALTKDTQFINVEHWEITENDVTLPLAAEAQNYLDAILKVSVKPINRKRKDTGETQDYVPSLKASKAEKHTGFEQLPAKKEFVKEDCFKTSQSVSHFTTNYTSKDIEEFQISKIYQLLFPKIANNKKKTNEKIHQLAEEQFSKLVDDRRPARLLDDLALIKKSVGRIFCGKITGTCFLLAKGIVITNLHVWQDIQNERNNSTDNQMMVKVRFNHEKPDQATDLQEVLVSELIARSEDKVLDYALLRLEEKSVIDNLEELGPKVRSCTPDEGILTIIGHPDGNEKVEQSCVIFAPHLWRSHAIQTLQTNQAQSAGFEFWLTLKRKVMSPKYDHNIAYHTNFFHGASASPCINNNGHILAMHTRGLPLNKNYNKAYVVEFGVSFAAIYNHLKKQDESLAQQLFPNIDHIPSPMDVK